MPAINARSAGLLTSSCMLLLLVTASFLVSTCVGAAAPRDRAGWTSSSTGLPASGDFYGVTIADVTRDGNPDILATDANNGVKVYLGDGTGCWTAVVTQPPATGGSDVRVGDFDGDGHRDLVTGSASNQNGVHYYRGNSGGGFMEMTSGSGLPTTGNWRGIALADVNKDGHLDIATSNGYSGNLGIRVYTGDGGGKFISNSSGLPTSGERDSGVVLADFNGDGNLDLAAGGQAGATCFLGNGGTGGTMSWSNSSTGLPANRFTGVNATDFDNDGLMDIVLSSYGDNLGVRAYRNVNYASSWASCSTGLPTNGHYIDVCSGDFDSDGNADLAFGRAPGTGIRCFYGNGAGWWTENSTGLPATDSYVGCEAGDLNNDQSLDLVFTSYSGKGLLAFRNLHAAPPQPSLELTRPLGDGCWSGGSRHDIGWNASNGTPPYNITLTYSTDSGGNFTGAIASGIAQNAAGPGSFDWEAPRMNSTSVRVRVLLKDAMNQTVFRSGLRDLSIDSAPPSIISTYPVNDAQGVPNATQVRVRFSEPMNRTSAEGSVSISGPASPTLGPPSWTGNELYFQTFGLRMESAYSVTVSTAALDASDPGNPVASRCIFNFSTSDAPVPVLNLDSPTGGEVWMTGSQHTISWTASGGTGMLSVNISYSVSGPDGPWASIAADTANDGGHDWTVPDTPSRDCLVCATVTDSGTPRKSSSDICTAPFEIKAAAVPLQVNLTSPAGGEVWAAQSTHDISWNSSGGNGNLTITLRYCVLGAGGPWNTIASALADTGLYAWTVPSVPSTACFVMVNVTDEYDPPQTAWDINPVAFTIKEAPVPMSVNLTSPAGGENWTAGTGHTITWTAAGGNEARSVLLQYSANGTAGPWTDIAFNETDDGSFVWIVPDITSRDCRIKISVKDGYDPPQSASDQGGAPFIISRPAPPQDTVAPFVHIDSPANGSSFVNGTSAVKATATDDRAVVRMELLIDGRTGAVINGAVLDHDWTTSLNDSGPHMLTVRAWDAAGNMGSFSVNVTVTAPSVHPPAGGGDTVEDSWWIPVLVGIVIAAAIIAAVLLRRRPPKQMPGTAGPNNP